MGLRHTAAKAISGVATWGLQNVVRRSGANTPGKLALYADPQLILHERNKLAQGSICVVGTNGKTTVTNLLADVVNLSGKRVVCNRTGANLDSGVATALLQSGPADWGVFECDELWLAKILPALQSKYVVLLNLFRDQLDRCGEIDHIQHSIVEALAASPETVLIYNADDPLCTIIAQRASQVEARAGVPSIAFGVGEPMGLQQNIVSDTTMCHVCSHMLEYDFRQYGQLGKYACPNCGFARPNLDYVAHNVQFSTTGLSFEVGDVEIHANLSGSYMVYNLLAVYVAAQQLGCSTQNVQQAIDAFNPKNGRLQEFTIGQHRTLLNLAKNPTGFNQNLRIVKQQAGDKRCAVAFFVNDREADGHDISWIWDIDFEELANMQNVAFFAGGIRKNDLQVRLKHADIHAELVDNAEDVFRAAAEWGLDPNCDVFFVVNYTALAPVHKSLDKLAESYSENAADSSDRTQQTGSEAEHLPVQQQYSSVQLAEPVVIAHLFPDLLNLYGDGGNVRILKNRLSWRGIPVEIREVHYGEGASLDFGGVDLVFLGGGPDREQRLAASELESMRDAIANYVEDDGALLAICGGYQILGRTWLLGDEEVPGLSILDVETRRPGTSVDRLIDNIALESTLAKMPVVGYENHAGRTFLGENTQPFGRVISKTGQGNNEGDHADGAIYKNVLGTYLHGPLLSKNPEVADHLLRSALKRYAKRTGTNPITLQNLPDIEEASANTYMAQKLI